MVTFRPKHPKWDRNLQCTPQTRRRAPPSLLYGNSPEAKPETLMPFDSFSRWIRQCSFQRTLYLVEKMRTVWQCMVSTSLKLTPYKLKDSWGLAFNRVLRSWRGKGSRFFFPNELQNGRTVPCKILLLVSLGQFGYFPSTFSVTIRLFHATNSAVLKEICMF